MASRLSVAAACIWASLAGACAETREYHYRMRGEVRALLIWIGRDGVGGGHIRVTTDESGETIEVLFGSDPARVPGGISRWGYGVERSERAPGGGVKRSVFEGFMRHSPEQSMAEARKADRPGDAQRYQAIRSEVLPDGAVSETRVFFGEERLDYRSAGAKLGEFRAAIAGRPPDARRSLGNQPRAWGEPQGFLAAVRGLLRLAVSEPKAGSRGSRASLPATVYVYNGLLYRLAMKKLEARGKEAKSDFEAVCPAKRTKTSFTLVFPLEGRHAGAPTRIVMQQGLWLRLKLDLVETR